MGVADADTGNIFAIANAGLAVGALFWGLAADVIGRKWAFNLTCLITSVFGLLLVCFLSTARYCSPNSNIIIGSTKVQLPSDMRHLFPRIARPRR
jgi:MFS family permease